MGRLENREKQRQDIGTNGQQMVAEGWASGRMTSIELLQSESRYSGIGEHYPKILNHGPLSFFFVCVHICPANTPPVLKRKENQN